MDNQSSRMQPQILRKIARHQLEEVFGEIFDSETKEELTHALVRQWISYDGHAGVITEDRNCWLKLTRSNEGFGIQKMTCPGSIHAFQRDWKFADERIPEILHQLNVAQSVEFDNESGHRLRLTMDPTKRSIAIVEENKGA